MRKRNHIILITLITYSILIGCNSNQSTGGVLQDINFSSGKYALYIKHKELGEFMVLDEKALEENKDSLQVNLSLFNYLPGEGDRSFGAILFKDNKLVTQNLGIVFKSFELGNLADYAVPVKSQRIEGNKKRIQEKIDSLKKNTNNYITFQSTFVSDNRSFRFRIYFPSIALPVTRGVDSAGYERIKTISGVENNKWIMEEESQFDKQWSKKIENCIREKAGSITDFEVSVSKGSMSAAYLSDKDGNQLRTPSNNLLYLEDFIYYDFTAYIMANKANAKKLLDLDYSGCINKEERNRPQVITKVKELVKQSAQPHLNINKGEVELEGYNETVEKYDRLYEQEYTLQWLEVKNE